jgi:homopolymeric O-antigen transport system permease protein
MTTASRLPGALFFRLLIHNHSLVYQLVRRDFEQRYVGSAVGWVWGLIHPLVLLGVYTFVFAYAFQARLDPGEVTDNYPLWLFAAMLPWLLFAETLQRSASSLVDYANLIKKSVFPAEVVPLSIFLSTLISHFLAMLLLLAGVAIWLHPVGLAVLVLPLYLVLLGMFSLGLSWIAAGLHVYLRDTAQVLTVVLTAWFWLTPIFMSESVFTDRFGGRLGVLLRINPLVYVVRGYRDMVLGNRLPAWQDVLALAGFSIIAFILGGLFFRHTKRGFADVL